MKKKSKMEKKYCFYCDAVIAENSSIGDHFPIPKRCGGKVIIPCCRSCHDMKDRVSIKNWPTSWFAEVIKDFPNLSRETRIFLAKIMSTICDSDIQKRILTKKVETKRIMSGNQYSFFKED